MWALSTRRQFCDQSLLVRLSDRVTTPSMLGALRCRFSLPAALSAFAKRVLPCAINDSPYVARTTSGAARKRSSSVDQPLQTAAAPTNDNGRSALIVDASPGSGSAAVNAETAIAASSTCVAPLAAEVTNALPDEKSSAHRRERSPVEPEVLVWIADTNCLEHPRCLHESGGQRTGASAG
jgi:hypothetical protein